MLKINLCLIILLGSAYSFSQTCEEKVGQMFMVTVPPKPHSIIGGVILFKQNFSKAKSPNDVIRITNKLQKGRRPPMFIAVDQEGGLVQRLNKARGFTKLPSHKQLGAANSTKLAYEFGRLSSKELSAVGINWNFGTVLDVNSNPKNPIIGKYGRSLGNTPKKVSRIGGALVDGQSEYGVIPTLKHFPGHGDTRADSHKGSAAVKKTLAQMRKVELKPFRDVIRGRKLPPAVMVGHISLPKILGKKGLPSSLSREIVTGLLREDMGHKGLIVTDDLRMGAIKKHYSAYEAARLAIRAGNDVLILGSLSSNKQLELAEKLCDEAAQDRLLKKEINSSFKRIKVNKRNYDIVGSVNTPSISGGLSTKEHQSIVSQIIAESKKRGTGSRSTKRKESGAI